MWLNGNSYNSLVLWKLFFNFELNDWRSCSFVDWLIWACSRWVLGSTCSCLTWNHTLDSKRQMPVVCSTLCHSRRLSTSPNRVCSKELGRWCTPSPLEHRPQSTRRRPTCSRGLPCGDHTSQCHLQVIRIYFKENYNCKIIKFDPQIITNSVWLHVINFIVLNITSKWQNLLPFLAVITFNNNNNSITYCN